MKLRRLLPHFAFLLALLALPATAQTPVEGSPKLIDYQGTVLDLNGNPLAPSTPTNYTMKFRLYSSQSGGASLWEESQTVTVSNGQFSVRLGQGIAIDPAKHADLSTMFNGRDRYLGLTVVIPPQAEGEITPRLAFLASPFSFVAERAKTADSVLQSTGTSTLGTTTITNLTLAGPGKINGANVMEFGAGVAGKQADSGKIGYGTFTANTLDIVGAGTALNGSDRKVKIWAQGGLSVEGPFTLSGNQTIPPPHNISFGNGTRQMINLWDTSFGIGIQNSTLYSRASDNFAWFRGGVHHDTQNNPGAGGTLLASLNINGLNVNTGQINLTTSNNVASILSSSSTIGTWLDLHNSSAGGTHWQLISTGSANGGGAGNLQIGTGGSAGTSGGVLVLRPDGSVSATGAINAGGNVNASSGVFSGIVQIGGANSQLALNHFAWADVTASLQVRPADNFLIYGMKADGNAIFTVDKTGVAAKTGGGSWASTSDVRLKKNIDDLKGALPKLMELHSVNFDFKDPAKYGSGRQTGFIAQEVEKVFPNWVKETPDKFKMISITGFESLTVQALRELREEKDRQIADRDARIAGLEKEITLLKATSEDSKGRLARLEKILTPPGTPSDAPLPSKFPNAPAPPKQLQVSTDSPATTPVSPGDSD